MNRCAFVLPVLLHAGISQASCGSSFCTVNTNWDIQGLSNDTGLLADIRYSYAKADRLMAGSSRKTPDAPSGADAEIEDRRTISELVNLNLDYAINRKWGVTLGLPLVMRDHSHTFDSSVSGPFSQQAKFSELGDIRLLGRYNFDLRDHDTALGIRFGIKLPTGATDKNMSPPDPSSPNTPYKLERSSQPGSGSTDGILGAYYYRNAPGNAWGWFVSGQIQSAIAVKDAYRPAREVTLDAGMHQQLAEGLNLLLQLNGQYRARDSGANANAASGGHSWNLSPGLTYALTPQAQLYALVQFPIARYANADPADAGSGQLVAQRSMTFGVTKRF